MVVIRWKNPCRGVRRQCEKIGKFFTLIRLKINLAISRFTFTTCCLTYNEHMSYNYAIDFFLEPLYWFVDNFAKYLGKVFVFCVTVLTAMVVSIAYWVGLPYWWERSPGTTVFLVLFGNWLLMNIMFHYYMGVITSPGYPPPGIQMLEVASICRKCISPKPQRTHHCSVCDRCVLGMDHHCPWLNNCVGFFNARYFYLYMAYMLAGVTFIVVAGLDLGYSVLWLNDTGGLLPNNDPDLIGHPVRINQSGAIIPIKEFVEYDGWNSPREHHLPLPPITEAQRVAAHPWKRKAVVFMAITCLAVMFALGTLTIMHGKNVAKGETSVESHTNAKLRKIEKKFRNPYDFGRRKNWKLFLGVTQGRTFLRHVLLPSAHAPPGNGVTFHTVHNLTAEDWP